MPRVPVARFDVPRHSKSRGIIRPLRLAVVLLWGISSVQAQLVCVHPVETGAPGEGVKAPRLLHTAEIQLTRDYPRVPPKCKLLTPIFHPNIDRTTICIGDHWTAGERLADLVIRIGEMLAYQAYNIKSPLNGEAAMWADLHADKLPTDTRNLHPTGRE